MNYSIDNLNDACVIAVLEVDKPLLKGLVFYPVPFMGDDDVELTQLIRQNEKCKEEVELHDYAMPSRYHAFVNLTSYSPALVRQMLQYQSPILAACNEAHINYMNQLAAWFTDIEIIKAPPSVHVNFEMFDPVEICKYARLFRPLIR